MSPLLQRVVSNFKPVPAYGGLDETKSSFNDEKRSLLKRGASQSKFAGSLSSLQCGNKSYYDSLGFVFSKKAAKSLVDENKNYVGSSSHDTKRKTFSGSSCNHQSWNKEGRLSKTCEKVVLASYSSTVKRDEMTTRKAVFGVTVTGEASFRYHA